tara:strand:+ start:6274 stop:6537 length:264 start_codon:yes stop_codon:yes gene_type:complete
MEKYEQKDNTGVLFVNDRKESENHPDSKGSGLIYGVECWISAWRKTSKNGVKYLSLSFQAKDDSHKQKIQEVTVEISEPVFDDDIPF